MRRVAGIDVGGTFTDLLLHEVGPDGPLVRLAKVPTSPANQAAGVIQALEAAGVPPSEIDLIVHGTTATTHAVLERKVARVGLITTRGFRDTLELGRRTRPKPYGLTGTFEPLIPRELRLEVTERIGAEGDVVVPLDEEEVRAAVGRLRELGAEALVIHFLHAYANPAHEERCAEIARQLWPNAHVTVGSRILPEFREFERGTTAALNAYIQPLMARYLGRLGAQLADEGAGHDLLVMQGNGGMMAAPLAVEQAVQTVMSGPAAGAIAAAAVAGRADFPDVITCDMGGTSFDVAVIRDGRPMVTNEKDIAYSVPVRVPMVDIHTIGAGGGSIARVNAAGILQVGPESAGALPGPVCYGLGGGEPTVTDANLVLGRLNPRSFAGATAEGGRDRVRAALVERVGRHFGWDAERTAAAILAVAANRLAGAIRLVSLEQGHDPRDFALFAFGGAGPLHAVSLARELGVPTVLVPRFPGITSALGCVLADVRHDFVQTIHQPLLEVSGEEIGAILREQARRGAELIAGEGVDVERIDTSHEADLLYRGQTHVLRVPVAGPGFQPEEVLRRFGERYAERSASDLPEMRAMLVNVRTTVTGRRRPLDLRLFAPDGAARRVATPLEVRPVYFDGAWLETPIYRREELPAGASIAGPAVVEQLDTTVLIDPGAAGRVDRWGNLVVAV